MKTLHLTRKKIVAGFLCLALILVGAPTATFVFPITAYADESVSVAEPAGGGAGSQSDEALPDANEGAAGGSGEGTQNEEALYDTNEGAGDGDVELPDETENDGAEDVDVDVDMDANVKDNGDGIVPLGAVATLGAAPRIVTDPADDGPGTLRDAIANAGLGDTIIFDASVAEITLDSALRVEADDLTIDGGGKVTLRLGDIGYRHIVAPGAGSALTLNGLMLNGLYTGPGSVGDGIDSGGVSSGGMVTLNGCTITNCYSTENGGAVYAEDVILTGCDIENNMAVGGGGIYAYDTAYLTNCTITGNTATLCGGGMYIGDSATLTSCTVSGNETAYSDNEEPETDEYGNVIGDIGLGGGIWAGTATLTDCRIENNVSNGYFGGGGGIYTDGAATLTDCTVSGNTANSNGEGVWAGGGGGIFVNGEAALTDCTVSGNKTSADFNVVSNGGGGMYFTAATALTGCTVTGNTASNNGGGFYSYSDATLTDCEISGNTALWHGGGFFVRDTYLFTISVTMTGCTVSDNQAGNDAYGTGGGIWAGNATLTDCAVSGNTANSDGGGLYVNNKTNMANSTVSGNTAISDISKGGGLRADKATMTGCVISGNSASYWGGGVMAMEITLTDCTVSNNYTSGKGGGVFSILNTKLNNCTVSGNTADAFGGGVYAYFGKANFINCTISGNSSGLGGGVGIGGTVALMGTVIAGNYCSEDGSESELGFDGLTMANYTFLYGDGELVVSGEDELAGSSYFVLGIPAGGLSALMETTTQTIGGVSRDVGLLKDNGSDTGTIMPADGLIDRIPVSDFNGWFKPPETGLPETPLTTDQRGKTRIFNGSVDVGAVEFCFAAAPVIDTHPQDLTLTQDQTDGSLSVDASSTDGGTLSWQWYSATEVSRTGGVPAPGATGGTLILGATESSYTPPSKDPGELYYYVVITNTTTSLDINTNLATSQAAKVTVNKPEGNPGGGTGGGNSGGSTGGSPGGAGNGSASGGGAKSGELHNVNNQYGATVKTGDTSNMALWLSLSIAAMLIAAGIRLMMKRYKYFR